MFHIYARQGPTLHRLLTGFLVPRPRLTDAARRTAQLRVRLTDGELATLQGEAAQAGIAFPDFVRERTLTGRVTVERGQNLPPDVWLELRRIGVNLNQIARFLNGNPGPASPPILSIVRQRADEVAALLARTIDADGDPARP